MTEAQINLIIDMRIPKMTDRARRACISVIMDDVSSYTAEMIHECPPGTVRPYVRKIYAEYDFCEEVMTGYAYNSRR